MRLQPVLPLLPDNADMVPVERVRHDGGTSAAVGPHHEVVSRPDDLVRPGEQQVTDLTAGLLGGLPPGCIGDGLAEFNLAAGQQPPAGIRAASCLTNVTVSPGPGTTTSAAVTTRPATSAGLTTAGP
jgi:hypothetical protein